MNSTPKCNFTDGEKARCERYTHLTREQRYQIANGLKQGLSQRVIANVIGVDPSTVSRELRRNAHFRGHPGRRHAKAGEYRRAAAHKQVLARRANLGRPRLTREDWRYIERLLKQKWSPEQVSLWLRQNGGVSVSHEWIYRYVRWDKDHGGDLHKHLRCQRGRRKRYTGKAWRRQIPNRVSIEQRPAVVDGRTRLGDWELDTVYGKNNTAVMLTMVERALRYVCVDILPNRTSDVVAAALVRDLAAFKDRMHSLTADNGRESMRHEAVTEAPGARTSTSPIPTPPGSAARMRMLTGYSGRTSPGTGTSPLSELQNWPRRLTS